MMRVFLFILWLCTRPSQASTKDFVGVLAGIENLTVFADGCLVGHNNGIWNAARWISFSGQTKIIAVSVYNEPKWDGGFLGVFSNGVVTDRSWKCKEANSPEDGWEQTSFNDDAWPDAYMSFNNSGEMRSYGVPSSIYWIHPANNRAVRFFCRRRFSTEEGNISSTLISILGSHPNNTIRLYLDGIFAAEAVDSLTILRKDRHKLQAVQVEDGSAEDVLFLASSTNGINSDKQWRCTNAFDEGWFLPNYTDISWPKVFVVANNTGDYFIAPEAKWIGYEVVSNRIYCRRTLTTEPVFQSLRATSCAHLQRGVKSLVATGSTNLKSSPRVEYSTNSVVSTTMIVTSSPAPTTAPVTKPQRVPNPLGVPGNRRQNRSGMETNRLPMLDILLIAVCSGFTAVIGLAACFCILKKRRSTREYKLSEVKSEEEANRKWEIKRDDVLICEELGHCDFGKVYKGVMITPSCIPHGPSTHETIEREENSTRIVVVKMLQENAKPDQKNDFLEEINLMRAVGSHKNIVSLIGCCTKSLPNFLIVEFAPKGDLLSYLRERRKKILKGIKMTYLKNEVDTRDIGQVNVAFSKAESRIDIRIKSAQSLKDEEQDKDDSWGSQDMLSFCLQIAQGMQYLSSKGIVHRGLAARNVLVCDNNLVKIANFGLRRSRDTQIIAVKWTSPEAMNEGFFTEKSDAWSYGVILWEIATLGGFPYSGIKINDLLKLLERGYRMEKPETCSEEFYQLMMRCWDYNPDARPTFTELCQDLEDWIQRDTCCMSMIQLNEDQPY